MLKLNVQIRSEDRFVTTDLKDGSMSTYLSFPNTGSSSGLFTGVKLTSIGFFLLA